MTEPGASGTMHRAQNTIRAIYYGYDLKNLYFRIDLSRPMNQAGVESLTFKLLFSSPEGYEAVVKMGQNMACKLPINARRKGVKQKPRN